VRPGEGSETAFFRRTLPSELPEDIAWSVTNSRVLPGYWWLGRAALSLLFQVRDPYLRIGDCIHRDANARQAAPL